MNFTTIYGDLGDENSTANVTETTAGDTDHTMLKVYLFVIFALIVVGNSTVLLAIALSKSGHHSRMNYFIMHLAIADLSVGLLSVSVDLVWRFTHEWHAGNVMCKLAKYLQSVSMYASTYLLVSLSIDRLDAIARPMNFSGSTTRARLLTGSAWFLSLVFALPMLALFRGMDTNDGYQCYNNVLKLAWQWKTFVTTHALALFILPGAIIAACYVTIVLIIWRKSERLVPDAEKTRTSGSPNGGHLQLKPVYSQTTYCSRGVIPQAKIRTVKMTLVIVLTFVACWSPYFVYNLLYVYGLIPKTSGAVATFAQALGFLNSAMNPIIYGIFSTRVCQNLRRLKIVEQLLCCAQNSDFSRPSTTTTVTYRSSAGSCLALVEAHALHGSRDRITSSTCCTDSQAAILLRHTGKDKLEP